MTESQKTQSFDTSQQAVGAVYAKALIGASEASGNTERILEEFDSLLNDVFAKQPKFGDLLASPRVSHSEKERILDSAFSGKMCDELLNFLKVTSRHGRLDCLWAVGEAVREYHNELIGRQDVTVRTAEPLTDAVRKQLTEQLEKALGGQVAINEEVAPDLIGGLVLRIGDTLYDGSVANQLQRLRETTIERTRADLRVASERFVAEDLNIDN